MNIDLKSDRVSCRRCVLRRRLTREETAEAIVPDALPDILRILDTQGHVCLRGKDSSDGRLAVTGSAELTVLYVPESGGGVKKITVSVPMELTTDCPEDMADALITADLTLTGADARTVNPRKVVVRAECACEAELYMPDTVCSTSPKEREGVFFKSEKNTLRLPVSVSEKTFVITDEAKFPDTLPAVGEILRTRAALTLESAKSVGSRAVLKGTADTEVIYESREGAICRAVLSSPFSQIVETDAVGDAADFDVIPALTSFYATRSLMDAEGGDVLSLEIHAVAQCVAYSDVNMERVTDAYNVQNPMELVMGECEVERLNGRESATEDVTVSVPTAERAAKVLAVTVLPASQSVRCFGNGGLLTAGFLVTVLYENSSGETFAASRRAELEREVKSPGTRVALSVHDAPTASVTDSSIEIRAGVSLSMSDMEPVKLTRVDSVEIAEDEALDRSKTPSVTVVRYAGGDLWDLAKSHLSTPELILEASGMEPESTPEKGAVLLVPAM